MGMKRVYAVGVCEETKDLQVWNMKRIKVELFWADGQIGVMPIFSTKKAAQKYLGDTKAPIISMEVGRR
jgi:hypothetical protein